MKLFITVKPHARHNEVEPMDANHFLIKVKSLPVEGKANDEVLKLLALHLDIPRSRLSIVSGKYSRTKTIEIH